jgi:PadR family transcriptional regulator PadR
MYQKELLKGNTETLILSLLSEGQMYGYQIVKEMRNRSSGYFRFKEGTLYPALHRLEKSGLVQGQWKEAESGVPRRYYAMTPQGQQVLSERLDEWRRFSQAVNLIMMPGTS